jgi:hypothetical protein
MSTARILIICCAVLSIFLVLELTRRRKLHQSYAILWLIITIMISFFSFFPTIFRSISRSLGITNPFDFVLTIGLFFLLLVCIRLTAELQRSKVMIELLAEEIALMTDRIDNETSS